MPADFTEQGGRVECHVSYDTQGHQVVFQSIQIHKTYYQCPQTCTFQKYLGQFRQGLTDELVGIAGMNGPRHDDVLYKEKYGYPTSMPFMEREFKELVKVSLE